MSRNQAIAVGRVVLLFVVAALLQTLVISRVSILGVSADLFLILTVILAISRGPLWGAVFGFVAGIAADIAYLQPLGLRALVYVVTGYSVALLAARFGTRSLWVVFLYTAGSSLAAQFVFGLFQYVMGPRVGLLSMLGTQILPEAVLDALVALPVYLLLLRLHLISLPRSEPARMEAGTE
jgi:rod shape-determining protein MreD